MGLSEFLNNETRERIPIRQYLAIAVIRKHVEELRPKRRVVAPRKKWLEWAENCIVRLHSEGGAEQYAQDMWEVWLGEVQHALWDTCFFESNGQVYGKGELSIERAQQKYEFLRSNLEYGEDAFVDTKTNGHGWSIDTLRIQNHYLSILANGVDVIYPDGMWDEIKEYYVYV